MNAPIVVIFEGAGRRSEQIFATISDAVEWLVAHGYTHVSGTPHYAPSLITRLYRDTGSGRRGRINTLLSDHGAWPVVCDQVRDRAEATKADQECAFWQDHYDVSEESR